jgi:acetyl esterase/lipase
MKQLFFLLLAVSAFAADKKKPEYPTDVRVEVDVAYLADDRKEKADLYFPKEMPANVKLPAVIWIHGGGFNDGDKAKGRETNFCHEMVLHGYVSMSINYKLRRMKDQVTWPQCVYDAKSAVRWLRANADKFGIDPERIAVAGGSAGGNLAAMLAVTGPADGLEPTGEGSTKVSCAIDFYGAVDLLKYHDMKMFAKTRTEAPELYVKGSPITHVDAQDAPLLLIHGTKDETVALSQSESLASKCKAAGLEHELIVVPDAPHTFKLVEEGIDLRPQVFAFLDKHLKQ